MLTRGSMNLEGSDGRRKTRRTKKSKDEQSVFGGAGLKNVRTQIVMIAAIRLDAMTAFYAMYSLIIYANNTSESNRVLFYG